MKGAAYAVDLKAPAGTSESAFQDLMAKINSPSSVDQVRSGVDSQIMQQLRQSSGLANPGSDTNAALRAAMQQ